MKHSLDMEEYAGWQRYWETEPWGPWRDNMHIAILAREIRRPQVRQGARIELDDFFVANRAARQMDRNAKAIAFLQMIATEKKR